MLQQQQPTPLGLQQAQRPYVSFERRGLEKRRPLGHPTEPGMLYVEEVDFVKITPAGSKDIFEKLASDWFQQLADKVQMGMESMDNQIYYKRLYEHWQQGVELPPEGTPIKGWPLATLAEQAKCIQIHILTVEALATCNQEAITRLGMGGMQLRTRAEQWLQAKNDTAPLVAKLEALQVSFEQAIARLENLEAENRVLKSMNKVGSVQGAIDAPRPAVRESVLDIPEEADPDLVENALTDGLNTVIREKANRQSALELDGV